MHPSTRLLWLAWILLLLSAAPARLVSAADPSAEADREFFEKKIRPIFIQHCIECHSAAKHEAHLRLDSAAGWLTGGDSGPVVVPGKPSESLLLSAVRYEGPEMPPAGRLSDELVQLLAAWVARGAPATEDDPALTSRPAEAEMNFEAARHFWAFQSPRRVEPPRVDDPQWSTHAIDRFLAARLHAEGLRPQPPADRTTLVRRLYFDLWGLPPSPEEIQTAEQDVSLEWYEQLVDRLLASPRFGERWGRHWLDLVRYGESLTLRGLVLPNAWRYRDYVIDSFNHDHPFDTFLQEQIAGDVLPADSLPARQRGLIATTFLTLGNTNLEEQDKRQLDMDVVDEQLDVIGKAFLGQSIGCARCHDHKFDPIPMHDYYALAGIFRNVQTLEHANVSQWLDVPLPLPAEEEAVHTAQEAALAAMDGEITSLERRLAAAERSLAQDPISPASLPGIVIDDHQAKIVGQWQTSRHAKPFVGEGYLHDQDQDKGEKTITFVPELPQDGRYEMRLAYTPGGNRATGVPVTVFSAEGEVTLHVNMREAPAINGLFVSLGTFRCEVAGQTFVMVSNSGTDGHVVVDAVQFLSQQEAPAADRSADPPSPAVEPQPSHSLTADREKLLALKADREKMQQRGPQRPRAMGVIERPEIADLAVHLRGSVHNLGDVVPRGFLRVVGPQPLTPLPANQSGRVELARWIASPDNPLPARVFTNRVWHWLFGKGLVQSVDNFGATGEPPTHPELLDHLALRFQAHDWSVKQLLRYVVVSQAYRQASRPSHESTRSDPENRLLAHQNRQRLDAECLRDALLAISGELNLALGGPSIRGDTKADYTYQDETTRRSVYVPVFRNALPELFEAFDFADPSMVVGRRNASTVAPQALFMLNHPEVHARAAASARRLLDRQLPEETRPVYAFRQTLGRSPSPAEEALVRQWLISAGDDPVAAWSDVYHLLFCSLDFRYRD